jgi:DNA-binding MarR family transcriptional regulator
MPRDSSGPRNKRTVFDELIDEVRRSQLATDRFDQAVADALDLNRTDMRCVDVLQREGRMTAGHLAEATGLTTGAMTTALDRLERVGYARRLRDPQDRRRVLVELTPRVSAAAGGFYSGHQALSERLYHRYSTEDLELLLRFVREGREFNERQAANLEQENRNRSARARTASRRSGGSASR